MKKSCFKGCFCSKAFTLIELLVVVLIIGVLAAIALPQYKLAVAKSRVAGYMSLLKSLASAQEAYYLAYGKYAVSLEELDISVPGSCEFTNSPSKNTVYCSEDLLVDNGVENSGTSDLAYGKGFVDLLYCPSYAAQGYTPCNSHGHIRVYFYLSQHENYPNKIRCLGLTDFGKKLCKTLPEVEVAE